MLRRFGQFCAEQEPHVHDKNVTWEAEGNFRLSGRLCNFCAPRSRFALADCVEPYSVHRDFRRSAVISGRPLMIGITRALGDTGAQTELVRCYGFDRDDYKRVMGLRR
jgi:hypothetical protein